MSHPCHIQSNGLALLAGAHKMLVDATSSMQAALAEGFEMESSLTWNHECNAGSANSSTAINNDKAAGEKVYRVPLFSCLSLASIGTRHTWCGERAPLMSTPEWNPLLQLSSTAAFSVYVAICWCSRDLGIRDDCVCIVTEMGFEPVPNFAHQPRW